MTISYTAVGILIGDPDNEIIDTDAIDTLVTIYGLNVFTVAAASARAIAATVAPSVTKKSGDVSINSSDKYDHYMSLAKELDRKAVLFGLGGASIYAGGISMSDKDTNNANDDRTPPYFTRTTGNDNDNALGADALLVNE